MAKVTFTVDDRHTQSMPPLEVFLLLSETHARKARLAPGYGISVRKSDVFYGCSQVTLCGPTIKKLSRSVEIARRMKRILENDT